MKINIKYYQTPTHECSYLPNTTAVTQFAVMPLQYSKIAYDSLIKQGFRRSGERIYKPDCPHCHACYSSRILVNEYQPKRREKRIINKNKDIIVHKKSTQYNENHYNLYQKYISSRHRGEGMDSDSKADYQSFLLRTHVNTVMYEYYHHQALIAVSVIDIIDDGLSAVYTYFDPELSNAQRSLGSFAILWLIDEAKRLQKPYVYLGYWIAQCQKMNYKTRYQPIELYNSITHQWELKG